MAGLDTSTVVQTAAAKTEETELIVEIWQQAERAAMLALQKYTLQDLCMLRSARQQSELMYYIWISSTLTYR